MPEAVIVSAARTPIGRANKGSLKDFRPDDLTALAVRAALDKVPALDPATIEDLLLGCGLPGGESGNNMARVVTTLLGLEVPGATITRYCSSSVQTTITYSYANGRTTTEVTDFGLVDDGGNLKIASSDVVG